jgi:transposase
LSKKESPINLSQEEIRAVYAQGEEAVVTLVTKLLERLSKLELRVEDLEGRISKTSRNSSKPPSGDGFGKRTKSLRIKSEKPSGGQPDHPGSTLEWRNEVDAEKSTPFMGVQNAEFRCQGFLWSRYCRVKCLTSRPLN